MAEMNFENLAPFADDAIAMQSQNGNGFSLWGAVKGFAGFAVGMAILGKASKLGAGSLF